MFRTPTCRCFNCALCVAPHQEMRSIGHFWSRKRPQHDAVEKQCEIEGAHELVQGHTGTLFPRKRTLTPAGASSRTDLRKSKTKWPCTISTPPKAKSCQVVQKRRSPSRQKWGRPLGGTGQQLCFGWINVDARRLKTFLCWEGCIVCRPIGTLPLPERRERPSFCSGTQKSRKEGGFWCRFAGTTRARLGLEAGGSSERFAFDVSGARASPAAASADHHAFPGAIYCDAS
jgi:hypothetical protein